MIRYNPDVHHRRSIRLKGYDYSQPGLYFITICCKDRTPIFGEVKNDEMILNPCGGIAKCEWLKTAEMREDVDVLEHVIMPNHMHGIILLRDVAPVGAYCNTPLPNESRPFKSPSKTIGAIIRGYKSTVTKQINHLRQTPGLPIWQRNYYEHIIRDEKSYHQIAEYIRINPLKWQDDKYYA